MARETGEKTVLARYKCLSATPIQTTSRGQDLRLRIRLVGREVPVILNLEEKSKTILDKAEFTSGLQTCMGGGSCGPLN